MIEGILVAVAELIDFKVGSLNLIRVDWNIEELHLSDLVFILLLQILHILILARRVINDNGVLFQIGYDSCIEVLE